MDELTQRVAAQYNRFPYPMDPNQIRADAFLDWLLAQVQRTEVHDRLRVLDAGCGTGSGIVPVAEMYPEAECVGIDISEQALRAARATAQRAGLTNLRLLSGDLMRAETLPQVDGGFDVIYASGVLHHLVDPLVGLRNLTELLAPNGVLVVMVYNSHGRAPVWRFARAMDLIWPDRSDYSKRVPLSRAVLSALPACAVNAPPWDDAAVVPDNELVDRYLHAHDRGYTVPELFDLLQGAGLSFLRWLEPRAWEPQSLLGPGQVASLLEAMPTDRRYAALDLLFDHPSLTLLATRPSALPRTVGPAPTALAEIVATNPQVALSTVVRRFGPQAIVTDVEVTVRGLAPQRLSSAQAAVVQASTEPMRGAMLVQSAQKMLPSLTDAAARAALIELLKMEVLFLPHQR